MNLDFNTLSTLLQLLNSKPQGDGICGQTNFNPAQVSGGTYSGAYRDAMPPYYGIHPNAQYGNSSGANSAYDGYANYGSGERQNGGIYSNNRFNKRIDAYSVGNGQNISPFTIQNGLGKQVDIQSVKKEDQTQTSGLAGMLDALKGNEQNPMTSILQTLSGEKPKSDNMSAMLPMLLNLLKKNDTANPQENAGQNSANKETNNMEACEPNSANGHISQPEEKPDQTHPTSEIDDSNKAERENGSLKDEASLDNGSKNDEEFASYKNGKTHENNAQPFKSIQFAGFPLISALNKLRQCINAN